MMVQVCGLLIAVFKLNYRRYRGTRTDPAEVNLQDPSARFVESDFHVGFDPANPHAKSAGFGYHRWFRKMTPRPAKISAAEVTVGRAQSPSESGNGRRFKRACEVGMVFISDLVVRGIIGVNDSERESPQEIVINLELFTDLRRAGASDDIADCIDYQMVAEKVRAHAETARRFTVEALAADIARIGLGEPGVERVLVRVEKPGAVRSCRSVGVEIERLRGQ